MRTWGGGLPAGPNARRFVTSILALLAIGNAAADRTPEVVGLAPVPWVELRFSAHKFFLSAATILRVQQVDASTLARTLRTPPRGEPVPLTSPQAVALTSETDLPFGRNETVTTWLDPTSGAAIQADKVTRGHNPYRKVFRYTDRGVYMWRSAPADPKAAAEDPAAWTRRSESFQESPIAPPAGLPITESYALLYLASAARLDRPESKLRLVILSDARLVELDFSASELIRKRLAFDEAWPGGERRRDGEFLLRKVRVTARPLDATGAGPDVDLGFLGMRGDLTILVEASTGIPVEVSGHAEHIGALAVRLDRVVLREEPATKRPTGKLDLDGASPSPTHSSSVFPQPRPLSPDPG